MLSQAPPQTQLVLVVAAAPVVQASVYVGVHTVHVKSIGQLCAVIVDGAVSIT
jgi:hypothetical protein